jgi:NADH:ubiquinone reductase (non-electrogenic)
MGAGRTLSTKDRKRTRVSRQRLLILGTGFGSFALLRGIDLRKYDVTVVSPRNHFLFTPLLPSTCVGTLEFRTVIEPIRSQRNGDQFVLGKAITLDTAAKTVRCQSVLCESTWEQPFDLLAIGVGCVPATFGVPGVEQHAIFLKEIDDARRIRQTLIANLERASLPGTSPEEQARLLHLVAVGGGPTGVRFAGELYDLLKRDLPRGYEPLIDKVRVTVVDSHATLLSTYDQNLRDYVQQEFTRRGVVLRTGAKVERVTEQGIFLKDQEFLPCGLVLWSTGFARNPLLTNSSLELDRAGRIITDDHLRAAGQANIYALGDCACPQGESLPQLAQVAEQQGRYLAKCLNARAHGQMIAPFQWKPWGTSSFIGGGAAVADGNSQRAGFWAYQQWRAATWTQLVSWRSRILVPLDRLRALVFGRDISRL